MAVSEDVPDDVSVYSDASNVSSMSGYSDMSGFTDDSSVKSAGRKKKKLIACATLGGTEVSIIRKKRRHNKNRKRNSISATSAGLSKDFDMKEWKVLGYGELGIDEMSGFIPDGDAAVVFGVVSISIGSGKFSRTKNVFINFAGKNCPGAQRGLAIQKLGIAHQLLGQTHCDVNFDEKEEVTLAGIFNQVGNLFVSDNLDVDSRFSEKWTFEEMQIMYQKEIEKKRQEYESRILNSQIMPPPIPKKVDRIQEILNLIHEDMSWVNWALFKPTAKKLKLYHEDSFGGGTIYAMRKHLSENEVLFGLLRMSFGVVPYRRSHFVMFTWVGNKIKRVKRGKLIAKKPRMYEMLQPHNIHIELINIDQVTVENIITRVRNIVTIDGEDDESAEIVEAKLIEEFEKALAEEEAANAAKEKKLEADKPPELVHEAGSLNPPSPAEDNKPEFNTAIDMIGYSHRVCDNEDKLNWMLVQHFPTKKKRKRRLRKKKTVPKKTQVFE